MLLDEPQKSNKLVVSGNNQLLRGSIFALITLVWFLFVFSFIDMNWATFTPISPLADIKDKNSYTFYFICFSFFISSLIFSFIFYKKNMQPTDLLLRFASIIMFLFVFYLIQILIKYTLTVQKDIALGGIKFVVGQGTLLSVINVFLTFFMLYLIFYPFILLFSKLFFNGFFGTAGFILCFFITATFHVSVYLLAQQANKLEGTGFPVDDLVVTLFFTLSAFGIGVISGDEEKPKKKLKSASAMNSLHRY